MTGTNGKAGLRNFARMGAVAALAATVAACNSAIPSADGGKAEINEKTKFSQASFGVKASPRVTSSKKVKKGGGRAMVGKPYKVRGKWYKPKEEPGYDRTGLASWYGPNFHGRLTANGEIYDQYHLSAAHPTFPLPSYARVTNKDNGNSVIVRVNDRGPFAHGRIIDLSSKAADLLDIKQKGVAKVRVEYVGRAKLEGDDMPYLMASYNRRGGFNPGGLIATGVMVASNTVAPAVNLLPGVGSSSGATALVPPSSVSPAQAGIAAAMLPDVGPVLQDRPSLVLPGDKAPRPDINQPILLAAAYAQQRVSTASTAFDSVLAEEGERSALSAQDIVRSWRTNLSFRAN